MNKVDKDNGIILLKILEHILHLSVMYVNGVTNYSVRKSLVVCKEDSDKVINIIKNYKTVLTNYNDY